MLGSAVAAVVRAQLRRRTGVLVGLAAIVALSTAVPLAGAAAARRAASSLDRALDEAQVADVSVDVGVVDDAHRAAVAALPEVARASSYAFTAVRPAGTELVGGVDLAGVTPLDEVAVRVMDQPRLVTGRLPRADRADEVALSRWMAEQLGLSVGDRLTLEAYRQDQVEAIFSGGDPVRPQGARITATVVGIGDPLEALEGGGAGFGVVLFSHAAWLEHGPSGALDYRSPPDSDVGVFRMVLRARLHGGADDEVTFLRHLDGIYGDLVDTTFSEDRRVVFGAASDTVHVSAVALALSSAAALLTGLIISGQALTRSTRMAAATDAPALRALGLSRRQRATAAVLPALIASLSGVLIGVAAAAAVSGWLPPGVVRFLEPERGIRLDGLVLAGGGAALLATLATVLVLAGRRATRERPPDAAAKANRLPALAAGATGAVALRLGRSTGGHGIPATSVVAATAGVAGVVAALVFAGSITHLTATARLWGAPWDVQVLLQADGAEISAREAPMLSADETVGDLSQFHLFETSLDGAARATTGMALEPLKGDVGPTVLEGRLPEAVDEIAVDADAVPGPGPHVGDQIAVGDPSAPRPMRVVGLLAAPVLGRFVVTGDAASSLEAEVSDVGFLIGWAEGVDEAGATAALRERFAQVDPPAAAGQVANLDRVRSYPRLLGVLLGLLPLAAVIHLSVGSVRRGRRDLAVARVLGFTRRQVRAVLAWQATAVVALGLVVGVPLGVAAASRAWRAVARAVQVVDVVALPGPVLLALVGVALVLANVVAAGPAWVAARRRAHEGLQAS